MSILYRISLHLLLLGLYSFPILYHCNLHVQLLCTWCSDHLAVSSEQRIRIILLLLYSRRSTRGTRKYSKVYPWPSEEKRLTWSILTNTYATLHVQMYEYRYMHMYLVNWYTVHLLIPVILFETTSRSTINYVNLLFSGGWLIQAPETHTTKTI